MSTTNAPCCTHPSNATTWPGQIVLNVQVKRHTKAQNNTDDLAIKVVKEAQEAQTQKGLKRLAAAPIQSKPRARKATKSVVGDTDSMMDTDEADSNQEAAENMEDDTAETKKKRVMKKGGKPLIRDTISNMQSKINEASSKVEGGDPVTHVSDGKDTPTPHINPTTQKFALGGRVTDWRSDVKPVKSELSQAFSISTRVPPTSIFSQGTASTTPTSDAQIPIPKPVAPAQIPDAEVASIFDDNLDFNKPTTPVAYESDDDFESSFVECEEYSQEPKAPFTQVDNPLKQNACVDEAVDDNEESMVSDWSMDIIGPDLEDVIEDSDDAPEPEPVVVKKERVQRTTSLTSVSVVTSVADSKPPAQKKVKVKPSAARAHGAPAIKHQLNVDTTPDCMKPRSAYRNVDLPATMQVDQCWTKEFLPTVMLWAGSYDDIWNIPDEELNITIVHGGVIHSLTAQHISKWCSNFGSTGIVIVLDFLMQNSDCNPVQLAKSLIADYAFLFKDPDNPSPLTTYRSPFVLQLLGTAHLNAINGYVEVPKLDTHTLTTRGMLGVIALCAAAIKRALNMFMDDVLKVKQVLASGSRGKLAIKLPKLLNKTTGKMTNAPFLFSGARWTKITTSFIKSISSKPAGYVETTIQMAHACTTLKDTMDTPHGLLDNEESEDNEHAVLCK
ncbi:hypothetical protein DFJ58DRAFT_740122 [Suillus subalutaceus]|uniref:uncharacterized protein n=1 Tax=Suillus subalutaceus TaxID=48586 RepID=UPI001B877374|nr:uncharacterized protein DFJ58DRAFT_740122 [Suillus subalutaceus]KAG1813069.1 hypothetical protein DFJ58DRAFT_740122 [Suillus subalutaceus]